MKSETCPRGLVDCTAVNNIISDDLKDDVPASFVCVGYNRPENREVAHDRFTLCWKNSSVDEMGHWDKRDLIDTVSVIASALSIDENIIVSRGMTEKEMDEVDLI